jgi:hypothetical protein
MRMMPPHPVYGYQCKCSSLSLVYVPRTYAPRSFPWWSGLKNEPRPSYNLFVLFTGPRTVSSSPILVVLPTILPLRVCGSIVVADTSIRKPDCRCAWCGRWCCTWRHSRRTEKTMGRLRERLWEMNLVPWWECPDDRCWH